MTETPRRGRPPTGTRKEVVQVPLEADDAAILDRAAQTLGRTKAELGRLLIKGELAWPQVAAAAKKARK